LRHLGRDIRSIGKASIAAIGPATAARLAHYGLKVAAMPDDEYRAEAIVAAIGIKRIRGKRFLIPRAQVAREILPELLHNAGAREVLVAPAYGTIKPKGAQVERMRELIAARGIDLVTFTSSSTVNNFCKLIGASAKGIKAASIGPITAETARRKGLEIVVTPSEYTIAALTQAVLEYFDREKRSANRGS
jgi:uroporphyrinogen III methyltransferase/synthase